MTTTEVKVTARRKRPHTEQQRFLDSTAKRKVVRAGRRGGKTTGMAIHAVEQFLQGKRILYAAPSNDQLQAFWWEVKWSLGELIDSGVVYKNEVEHIIEFPGTRQRIRAKTAFNADMLRGDYADLLILDEWQLCDEQMWELVGAPMLLDNDGDAVFIYTPPSLRSRSVSKARDKLHAAKMYKAAQSMPRWETFSFSSHDNPHISASALEEITQDMTHLAYQMEIMAEDIDEVPGALWTRATLEANRVWEYPELVRICVAIDPAVTATDQSDETGIVVGGISRDGHGYVLEDLSGRYSPDTWARIAVNAWRKWKADRILCEVNNGGDMVIQNVQTVDQTALLKKLHASRGKAARAEPIAARYEQERIHHVGQFEELEDQLVTWDPLGGSRSPDRLDALVWLFDELKIPGTGQVIHESRPTAWQEGNSRQVTSERGASRWQ